MNCFIVFPEYSQPLVIYRTLFEITVIYLSWPLCVYQYSQTVLHNQGGKLSWSNVLNTQPSLERHVLIKIWRSLRSCVLKTNASLCLTQFLPQIVWLWDRLFLKQLMISQGSHKSHAVQFGNHSYKCCIKTDDSEFGLFFSHYLPVFFGSGD